MVVWDEENAAHLMARAGFGGSVRDNARYARMGQQRAVERLITVGPTGARAAVRVDDPDGLEKIQTWWAKRMVKASSRRLQEKMCLFWHDHFASGASAVQNNLWMSIQNKTFRLYGLGSFKTLVYQVTKDPAMLEFLDGRRNRSGKPNENYARELMELFTLGVIDLNGADNYTQTDVTQLARALTGFVVDDHDTGVFVPSRFDGGTKTLFAGKSFQASGNLGVEDGAGNLLPPAQNVVDIFFTHRDSDGALTLPRFLANKLWEYFAYPVPAKALLDELTAGFIANGFVVSDLLRAMFLHDEFYSPAAKTSSVKNPCEYTFHAMRALEAKTNGETLADYLASMGMTLFDPPNVAGWNNGFAWLSSGQYLARLKFAQALAAGRDRPLLLKPTRLFDPSGTSAAAVVDSLLGHLGIASRVPAGVRQGLIDYFGGATNFTDTTVVEKKVRGAIALMLELPEFHIH
ncbi:MAG: DUF1800 domain-containing protein [Deltaproteobacteria bacterium]|nr:MAG: DUF1800 domain-containing protein [Deltaproteobacteria bacterium]